MEGGPPPSPSLSDEVLATITGYTQGGEQDTCDLRDDWLLLEVPQGFVQII
jgi:hypothetical protein